VEEVEAVEVLRERVKRPAAGEREHRSDLLLGGLQLRRVGDVLAQALLARAGQVDGGRQPLELGRDRAPASLERVGVDLERELGERVVQGHGLADSTVPRTSQDVGP
jgi:hypothetical protein